MNEENRQKVNDHLDNKYVRTTPLLFLNYKTSKEEFDPNKYSVEDMVKRAFWLTNEYISVNSENYAFETYPQRWRSSLDIWRHIKFYYPEVTIFDVMRAIYNIQKELGGQFCTFIGRRTFRIRGCETGSDTWTNHQEYQKKDEYGLDWDDWKDI